jgi:hypothetical protein
MSANDPKLTFAAQSIRWSRGRLWREALSKTGRVNPGEILATINASQREYVAIRTVPLADFLIFILLGWPRLKVFKPSRVKVNTGRTVRILKGISTISLIAVVR